MQSTCEIFSAKRWDQRKNTIEQVSWPAHSHLLKSKKQVGTVNGRRRRGRPRGSGKFSFLKNKCEQWKARSDTLPLSKGTLFWHCKFLGILVKKKRKKKEEWIQVSAKDGAKKKKNCAICQLYTSVKRKEKKCMEEDTTTHYVQLKYCLQW